MEISDIPLFFFSALGAFNGLLLSIYFLFFSKRKNETNFFLGLLLLSLSIRIGKSVFFYFNPDLAYIYLQLGLSALVFAGPSLFFFLKSLISTEESVGKSWVIHYGLLALAIVVGGVLYPFEHHVDLWRPTIIDLIYYTWLVYIIAAAPMIYPILQNAKSKIISSKSVEYWVLSIFYSNVLIWIAYTTCRYTSYIAGALSFSFVFYLTLLLWTFRKRDDYQQFEESGKYPSNKLSNLESQELLDRLETTIRQENLYTDANLKVSDLAQAVHLPSYKVSMLINDQLQKNFPTYINEYRIERAKEMILDSTESLSMEGIGYECGFNSKSTFYTTFKKMTGMTPAAYRESMDQ